MSEYLTRTEGGFYIVDEVPGSKLLAVRRAVHQVIDPKTNHPWPEIPVEQQYWNAYKEALAEDGRRWRDQYECSYTNSVAPGANLTRESLEETLETLRQPLRPRRWEL